MIITCWWAGSYRLESVNGSRRIKANALELRLSYTNPSKCIYEMCNCTVPFIKRFRIEDCCSLHWIPSNWVLMPGVIVMEANSQNFCTCSQWKECRSVRNVSPGAFEYHDLIITLWYCFINRSVHKMPHLTFASRVVDAVVIDFVITYSDWTIRF